ncbi:FAD-binding oxidoreductase [Chitinophaga sedimenti]|uniref:NAD(P)/FAD-dependent oxidoreductase n=1 Tax=Chitinophaga sedimenti TaxID=2033606 RepID=UPI002005E589|nr:FAD-binding oxidoreductase [Chitinophaga sedimenti]MCK7557863.1 FAD-binding oxidoreductase [Chitinophaga sedimenti]
MQTDFIIVGQGIAGTMLSWFLMQEGKSVHVFDVEKPNSSSRVAAGIINPVSGRKFELAWMYDTFYPFAVETYRKMEKELGISCFSERDILHVWPSEQMRDAFAKRQNTAPQNAYFKPAPAEATADLFHQPLGTARVQGATVNLRTLLPAWRNRLKEMGCLHEEQVDVMQLAMDGDCLKYGDITADYVIFCEGADITGNYYLNEIPFLPNKGEALLIKAPGLDNQHIIKKSITLVPQGDDLYWAGSNFDWDFEDATPGDDQRAALEASVAELLKIPYTVEGHIAAIRPSTKNRRPAVGLHPTVTQLGVLNGLGTKGCSLAPYLAWMFAQNLVKGQPMLPETDIKRYFNAP